MLMHGILIRDFCIIALLSLYNAFIKNIDFFTPMSCFKLQFSHLLCDRQHIILIFSVWAFNLQNKVIQNVNVNWKV